MKLRRVIHSSYGAEILACADADDGGYCLTQTVQKISRRKKVMRDLNVYSKGLDDKIKRHHEGNDYRLRQTVQLIRDSFQSEDLDSLKLIEGFVNLADPLTKHNPASFKPISTVLTSGKLELPNHDSYTLYCSEWK